MNMELVADSNALQSDGLRSYLEASKSNFVVLPDFLWIEAFAGNPLKSVPASIETLAGFPSQLLHLRSTGTMLSMKPRRKGLRRRMISADLGAEFNRASRHILAGTMAPHVVQRMERLGQDAAEIQSGIAKRAAEFLLAMQNLQHTFTESEIKQIRKGTITDSALGKIFAAAVAVSRGHYTTVIRQKFPSPENLPNAFSMRFSIALQVLFVHWMRTGSSADIKSDRLKNDMIDLMFAVYATYFDGLLSSDNRAMRLFEEIDCIFRQITGRPQRAGYATSLPYLFA